MNVLVFKSRVIGKAWINIETDNREVARNILPPACCANATIVRPNKFTMEEIDDILVRQKITLLRQPL